MLRHFRLVAIAAITCVVYAPASAQPLADSAHKIQSNAVYNFPACTVPAFNDVPTGHIFCKFIKQFATDGITAGCGAGNFCPNGNVTRGEMAVFMEGAMRGTASWSPWQGIYAQTIIVSPVPGGTQFQNGTALLNAIAGITDEGFLKRYLVKIEPGKYNFNTSGLVMPQHVDLEGSGRNTTILTATANGGVPTVTVATDTQIRSLTIESPSSVDESVAISSSANFLLSDVEILADEGTLSVFGIKASAGIASMQRSKMTVTATTGVLGAGYFNETAGSIDLRDSEIIVSGSGSSAVYGLYLSSAVALVRDSRIRALGNGATAATGITGMTGAGVFVNHSSISAENGASVIALSISSGTARVRHSTVLAVGGSTQTGAVLANTGGTVFLLNCDVEVNAQGSAPGWGVQVKNLAEIRNSSIDMTGTDLKGVTIDGGWVEIDASQIGGNPSVSVPTGTARIGGSRLDSATPVSGAGTKVCSASYNSAFLPLSSTCAP